MPRISFYLPVDHTAAQNPRRPPPPPPPLAAAVEEEVKRKGHGLVGQRTKSTQRQKAALALPVKGDHRDDLVGKRQKAATPISTVGNSTDHDVIARRKVSQQTQKAPPPCLVGERHGVAPRQKVMTQQSSSSSALGLENRERRDHIGVIERRRWTTTDSQRGKAPPLVIGEEKLGERNGKLGQRKLTQLQKSPAFVDVGKVKGKKDGVVGQRNVTQQRLKAPSVVVGEEVVITKGPEGWPPKETQRRNNNNNNNNKEHPSVVGQVIKRQRNVVFNGQHKDIQRQQKPPPVLVVEGKGKLGDGVLFKQRHYNKEAPSVACKVKKEVTNSTTVYFRPQMDTQRQKGPPIVTGDQVKAKRDAMVGQAKPKKDGLLKKPKNTHRRNGSTPIVAKQVVEGKTDGVIKQQKETQRQKPPPTLVGEVLKGKRNDVVGPQKETQRQTTSLIVKCTVSCTSL